MIRIDKTSQQAAILLGALSLFVTAGCSTKNYVRTQTTPLVTKTNELDDAVATNNRQLHETDERAQQGHLLRRLPVEARNLLAREAHQRVAVPQCMIKEGERVLAPSCPARAPGAGPAHTRRR